MGDSVTPEHDRRDGGDHGFNDDGPLHPDLIAAYDYVSRVLSTRDALDAHGCPMWYGWALREAFLAGQSHQQRQPGANQSPSVCTTNRPK